MLCRVFLFPLRPSPSPICLGFVTETLNATMLIDHAMNYLLEGSDDQAAAWLKSCPLVDAKAQRPYGTDIRVELQFGCSRRDMDTFWEDEQLREESTAALNAVTG